MREIAKGVQLFRTGEALAQTGSPQVNVGLLAASHNVEVMRFTFLPGALIGVGPGEDFTGLECYVVLDGTLVTSRQGERIVLGPGDTIAAAPAGEVCMFEAETSGTVLYISSEPFFQFIDNKTRSLWTMAVEIEAKDGYTRDHCTRLQKLAHQTAAKIGLPYARRHELLLAALLHDIGKVKVPEHILGKPASLTPEEWEIMRKHAEWGQEMIIEAGFPEAAAIVGQHHERLNGSGYPRGLVGDQICTEAKIIAICDSWDAMTTDRVYRKGLSTEQAIAELKRGSGTLYDPELVTAFLSVLSDTGLVK